MIKFIVGVLMMITSYVVVFVPKTFELLNKYISISEIQGLGFVFIGIGILGFFVTSKEIFKNL